MADFTYAILRVVLRALAVGQLCLSIQTGLVGLFLAEHASA
jgi:hypothetical protein